MKHVVRAIVMDKNGRVLLFHFLDSNRWGLPGGLIDKGESPQNAMIRELYSETGFRGSQSAFINVGKAKYGHYIFHTFFVSFEALTQIIPSRRPIKWTDGSSVKGAKQWVPRKRM